MGCKKVILLKIIVIKIIENTYVNSMIFLVFYGLFNIYSIIQINPPEPSLTIRSRVS